jgi:hypothetical protein
MKAQGWPIPRFTICLFSFGFTAPTALLFFDDTRLIVGRKFKAVVDHRTINPLGKDFGRRRNTGSGNDSVTGILHSHSILGDGEIDHLLHRFQIAPCGDGCRLHVPTGAFAGHDDLDRGTFGLGFCAAEGNGNADRDFARRGQLARFRSQL